ncbi:protein FAM210A-like [Uloborus diversus]|uniref:protein FAM210A-like n=1 Tax=Uloborus diversus TaxID=327109 RepID=UPI0024095A36|nr:protein FAM210A-like [Uloborus diversus]
MILLKTPNICRRLFQLKYPIRVHYVSKQITNEGIFVRGSVENSVRSLFSPVQFRQISPYCVNQYFSLRRYKQHDSKKPENVSIDGNETDEPPEKLSIFQRYKKMLKEYWYVLLPVHMVTSALWFGGFYYAAKSGLDIIPFLEYINVPEQFIKPLRNSSLGHIAVASAFYKIATPARYMVTIGGTTFAVKFLTKRGLIRPVPTKAELKTMLQNKLKKDSLQDKKN